jgi:hypothetical protein
VATDLYRWWVSDSRGKLRLTGVLMTPDEALKRFPGAKPERSSQETWIADPPLDLAKANRTRTEPTLRTDGGLGR